MTPGRTPCHRARGDAGSILWRRAGQTLRSGRFRLALAAGQAEDQVLEALGAV